MNTIQLFTKNVSTRKKKQHNKRQLSRFNETLYDFIIGNNNNADTIGHETAELRPLDLIIILESPHSSKNSSSQDQVIEKNIADKIRKEVDNAVMSFGNRMYDAISTAMDNVVVRV